MTLLLGIYHHRKALNAQLVQPMVDAFAGFPHRHMHHWRGEGCWLVSGTEDAAENNLSEAEGGLVAGVVGTLVRDGLPPAHRSRSLLDAWREGAHACLPKLHGAWAAALYDPVTHSLHLANDKFGMRPLYVCAAGDYLAFCNELEPLLHLPGFSAALDQDALAEYFGLGTTLDGHTLVQGIHNLAPATHLQAAGGSVKSACYWVADIAADHRTDLAGHAERLADVLRTVVAQLPQQLTNIRCLVSAGADTRLILSCLPAAALPQISFFTSSLAVLPMDEDRDVIGARMLAQRLGLQHEVAQIAFSELAFGESYFDRVRRSRYRKVLGGWHGGEYLGGFCSMAAPVGLSVDGTAVQERLQGVFRRAWLRRLARHPMEGHAAAVAAIAAEQQAFAFQVQQLGRAYFSSTYRGSRGSWLQPVEIVTQGFSPFWDSRFLEALLAVPWAHVAGYGLYNEIFRRHLTALTDIPSNSPLTQRADSALPRMEAGREPKVVLQPQYAGALARYRRSWATWSPGRYAWWRLRKRLRDGSDQATLQFIDFEAWRRRYLPG